jgi:hypothetical protein
MRLQRQLATLSPRGTLAIADGSGHDIATDRPALVTAAVRTMVDAVSAIGEEAKSDDDSG